MTSPVSPVRTPLTAVLVAILLAGCAYHSEYHAVGAAHRSIKDDPAPVASTPAIRPPVRKVAVLASEPAAKPRSAPAVARTEAPPAPSQPQPAVKSAIVETPLPPKSPIAIPAPTIALPTMPPAAVTAPQTPGQAAVQPPTAPPQGERTRTELRRAAPVIGATPPSAPAAAAAEPAPAKPIASAIVIQPKAPAAQADAPAQPKVVALTDEQRVRDTIARAQEHLAAGRLINARSLLQDAARDSNPLLLTALAETFDPLYLRDKHPTVARSAEATRALDLYRRAAERGSASAAQKLKTLADFIAANPGFAKP